jgi:hypothetical protein
MKRTKNKAYAAEVKRIAAIITKVVDRKQALDLAWLPLTTAVKSHDFPAWVESYQTFDAYLDQVAIIIKYPTHGTPNNGSWLAWFIYDNLCGKNELPAKAAHWKSKRPIRTPIDLAKVIIPEYMYPTFAIMPKPPTK